MKDTGMNLLPVFHKIQKKSLRILFLLSRLSNCSQRVLNGVVVWMLHSNIVFRIDILDIFG